MKQLYYKIILTVLLLAASQAGGSLVAGDWTTAEGFAIPRPGKVFQFPRDHGSHPDFGIEWWYVTGHLFETNGARYGFQATFFRRSAPRRDPATIAVNPDFQLDQIYLGHMALLEVGTAKFRSQERLNRSGWDANAARDGLDIRNGNWTLCAVDGAKGEMELNGSVRGEARFELRLLPDKPMVIFGVDGVSRKAQETSAASHYITYSRLAARGTLRVGSKVVSVSGLAWMDHEFSSSQLGTNQVGWDWACLQLNDGREIMAYRMRREDGKVDPYSTLAWVDQRGVVRQQGAGEYTLEGEGTWISRSSGARYPAAVRLTATDPATGQRVQFLLKPLATDQELDGGLGGIPYWEGACQVLDEAGHEVGQSFLELTGYAGSMKGRL